MTSATSRVVLCMSSALLQLMAAAEARRDVCYFTFGDKNLCEELIGVHSFIVDKQLSVGERRVCGRVLRGGFSHDNDSGVSLGAEFLSAN